MLVPSTSPPGEPAVLRVLAVAPRPIEAVEIVRSGRIVERFEPESGRLASLAGELPDLVEGEYVYVRVLLQERGAAWSSPFFIDGNGP